MEKFRILVIDDKIANLEAAEKQFAEKNVELIVMGTYAGAVYFINNEHFDIVLSDLMLPGDDEGISCNNPEIGQDVPYGLLLAILAKNRGVEKVAILTDISHHAGPIAWSMDKLMGINPFVSCFSHKNWLEVASKFVEIGSVSAETEVPFHTPTVLLAGHGDDFKRSIQKEISSKFKVIFIEEESNFARTFNRFIGYKPNFTIIVGEITKELKESSLNIGRIFKDLQGVKTSEQKVFALGFLPHNHPDYVQLPLSISEILTRTGLV
ncbi:MAG: response regulator [Candidatus Falkowbacteria bacterium]